MSWLSRSVDLQDIPALWPRDTGKLATQRIVTAADLVKRVADDNGLADLSAASEIPLEVLFDYHLVADQEEKKRLYRRLTNVSSMLLLPLFIGFGLFYASSLTGSTTSCEEEYRSLYETFTTSNNDLTDEVLRILTESCQETGEDSEIQNWMVMNILQISAAWQDRRAFQAISAQNPDVKTYKSASTNARAQYQRLKESASHQEIGAINDFSATFRQAKALERALERVEAEVERRRMEEERDAAFELAQARSEEKRKLLEAERDAAFKLAQANALAAYNARLQFNDSEFGALFASYEQRQSARLNSNIDATEALAVRADVQEKAAVELKDTVGGQQTTLGELGVSVSDLKADVAGLDGRLTILDSAVVALHGSMVSVTATTVALQTRADTHERQIDAVETRLDNIEGSPIASTHAPAVVTKVSVESSDCRVIPLKEVSLVLTDKLDEENSASLGKDDEPVLVDIKFDVDGGINIEPQFSEHNQRDAEKHLVKILKGYFDELNRTTQGPRCKVTVVYQNTEPD